MAYLTSRDMVVVVSGRDGTVRLITKGSAMSWTTRERPKFDRIACLWLIARAVDAAPIRGVVQRVRLT